MSENISTIESHYDQDQVDEIFEKYEGGKLVEVVRCKDCKYFKYGDYCTQDEIEHSKCRKEDYCSYGELK